MKRYESKVKPDTTFIYDRYQKGVDWHNKNSLYSMTDKCHAMFNGDQWRYVESGDETLPQYNFIQPVCEYKIAMVAMNNAEIVYSSDNSDGNRKYFIRACEQLNKLARQKWEQKKLDAKSWEIIKQACIGGDAYVYFYNANLDFDIVDRANIYLSDEQQPEIQKQKYIIIEERRFVDDIKEEAQANGIDEAEISGIMDDDDTDTQPDNVKGNEKDGKCLSLLYICKKDGEIYFSRSTKTVVYQPETKVDGLSVYPIASLLWSTVRGSARGIGEVEPLMPNQIMANKLLARREINLKMVGFAKPVYLTDGVSNPEDIDKVGAKIGVKGASIQRAQDAFGYINPAPIPAAASELQQEIITISRDLANAGDSATGNVNPEKASGAAIIAVRDQQAISTTPNVAAYKQFVEDVAIIWLDVWTAYNPDGISVAFEEDGEEVSDVIPPEILAELSANIRIDISPVNPYSKYASMQFIENLVASPMFQNTDMLQEYHDLLPDDGIIPKGKIQDIIDARREAEAQMMQTPPQIQPEMMQGGLNELPEM